MKTVAVILAGGEGSRLGVLTAKRTKPAVPFGGKFRIIDFALSNCVNSGLYDVMIVAQYRPHSLIEHIGAGGPWDLNRERTGGVRIYSPYRSREHGSWFAGTADAVQQNFLFVKDRRPDLVVILSGDHIYRMNYNDLIADHLERRADVTLATMEVTDEEKSRFGVVQVDEDERVTKFVEKPKEPVPGLGSMGIYIFNYGVLDRVLLEDSRMTDSNHDFGKDILPRMIARGERVYSWMYKGYWRDVGTIDSYWEAHMDLIGDPPLYDLNDLGWLIHTRSENRPPARLANGAIVSDSLITHGCTIGAGARVEKSVLSAGVRIEPGAIVRESVLLTDCVVEEGAVVERAILDKRARVGKDARVGAMPAKEGGPLEFAVLGKNSVIPAGFCVSAGAEVGPDVIPSDLGATPLARGAAVFTKRRPHEV
ncbi:MAG: sugar phosphate nucleotidyltransferase [Myxococcota bacterium]|nr:sugar phosphate nucleotidyltransferase [Myxococcota bacterium]